MKEIKQEKINKANDYYRVLREEKSLGRFIRLVDIIFVTSKGCFTFFPDWFVKR